MADGNDYVDSQTGLSYASDYQYTDAGINHISGVRDGCTRQAGVDSEKLPRSNSKLLHIEALLDSISILESIHGDLSVSRIRPRNTWPRPFQCFQLTSYRFVSYIQMQGTPFISSFGVEAIEENSVSCREFLCFLLFS
ncbi:hypothetical protein B296_00049744 [Ensete ventricosum]|uniref:Uncharacterized protein n=1 Tax=Ensete ventricosum TaxID=4639 RepID=A0A426Y7H1_ENSVE|nr:hypothetical protein B296_00049744 [Ensete ventricosum]